MKKQIRIPAFVLLAAALGLAPSGCSSPGDGPGTRQEDHAHEDHVLELRAGDTREVEGWSRTDLIVGGSPVWMAPEVAVDDDMVVEVREMGSSADSRSVLVTLDEEGSVRLRRLSTDQLSRAIVVVVDGKPTSAPLVMSPLESRFVITAAHLDRAQWDDFVRRLRPEDDAFPASAE
ncbi:MAG: hypothetical protein VX672_04840 [Planctomycetota bacterium]|nr:hypothetical protein [Planctomycetota bacterium]